MPTSLRGAAVAPPRRKKPPPQPGQAADARIWASRNLRPQWEMPPPPRPKPPPSPAVSFHHRDEVVPHPTTVAQRQMQRKRNIAAATGAVVNAPQGIRSKMFGPVSTPSARPYLAKHTPVRERAAYYERLKPPPKQPGFLSTLGHIYHYLAQPGPQKYEQAGRVGLALGKGLGEWGLAGAKLAAENMGVVGARPLGGGQALLGSTPEQRHEQGATFFGRSLENTLQSHDFSHPLATGLEAAAIIPGVGEGGGVLARMIEEAGIRYAAGTAAKLPKAELAASMREGVGRALGLKPAVSKELFRAASANTSLNSPSRAKAYAAIDRAMAGRTEKERNSVKQAFDIQAHIATEGLSRTAAKRAAARAYDAMANEAHDASSGIAAVRNSRVIAESNPHVTRLPPGGVKPLDPEATAAYIDNSIKDAKARGLKSLNLDRRQLAKTFVYTQRMAEVGAAYRKWYQTSARAILAHVGGNVDEADKLAQLFALYSANRAVPENSIFALRAYDEFKTTGHVTEGSGPQQQAAENVMKGIPWQGRKTNSFYGNISKYILPADRYKAEFGKRAVTVDIWMMRMFGYRGKLKQVPTKTQYTWIENHIQEIARQLGWQPEEVQAAAWVAMKAEEEGRTLPAAAFDFAHGIAAHTGEVRVGAAPQNLLDQIGPEISRITGTAGVGGYESGRGSAAYIPMTQAKGTGYDYTLSQGSRQAAEEVTAAWGQVLDRESVAYGRVFTVPDPNKANAVELKLGGTINDILAERISAMVGEGTDIIHSHDGAWLVKSDASVPNKVWVGQMEAALLAVDPELQRVATTAIFDGRVIERSEYGGILQGLEGRKPGAAADLRRLEGDARQASESLGGGRSGDLGQASGVGGGVGDAGLAGRGGADLGGAPERGAGAYLPRIERIGSTDHHLYIGKAGDNLGAGDTLKVPHPERLADSKVFFRHDREAGFSVSGDGEMFAVFKNAGEGRWAKYAAMHARDHGATWLRVAEENPAAIKGYTQAGFRTVAKWQKPDGTWKLFMSADAPIRPVEVVQTEEEGIRLAKELAYQPHDQSVFYQTGGMHYGGSTGHPQEGLGARFGRVPGQELPVATQEQIASAEERLAFLDQRYEKAIQQVTPHVDPFQGPADWRGRTPKQQEQRFRNMGAKKRKGAKMETVTQEVRRRAEEWLHELAQKHPNENFARMIEERDRLRTYLEDQGLARLAPPEPLPPEPAAVPAEVARKASLLRQKMVSGSPQVSATAKRGLDQLIVDHYLPTDPLPSGFQPLEGDPTHELVDPTPGRREYEVRVGNRVVGSVVKHANGRDWVPTVHPDFARGSDHWSGTARDKTIKEAARRLQAHAHGIGPTAEDIPTMLRSARSVRALVEKGYSQQRAERIVESERAYEKAGGGLAGHHASKGALSGKLEQPLEVQGFKHFTPEALDALLNTVHESEVLRPFERVRARDGLEKAYKGIPPTESEIRLLEKVFGKDLPSAITRETVTWRKWAYNLLGIPRALQTSFDLSAPFRQGLLAGAGHPVMFAKNFGPMIKSASTKTGFEQLMAEIEARPSFDEMEHYGVRITDTSSHLAHREEAFVSQWAEHIPGVGFSSRGYTGFLNKMRADLWDQLAPEVKKAASTLEEEEQGLKDLAEVINASTGRGGLGRWEKNAVGLNQLLFSPRLLASRIKYLDVRNYWRLSPVARREMQREVAVLLGTAGTLMTLAYFAVGARIQKDPRNSDFGKVRFGNTRIDMFGGFLPLITQAAQIASGTKISPITGKTQKLSGGFGSPTQLSVAIEAARKKLAPVPGFVTDLAAHSTVTGQKMRWQDQWQRVTPLSGQDIYATYAQTRKHHTRQQSLEAALGATLLSELGVGVQSFGPHPPKRRRNYMSGGGGGGLGGSLGGSLGGTLGGGGLGG